MRRGLLAAAITTAVMFGSAGEAMGGAPTLGHKTNQLGGLAPNRETNHSGNIAHVTVVVKHDPGDSVDQLVFDDDWDGTNDPTSVKTNITPQKPSIQGGYDYTRVSYSYTIPTSNTGMSCPLVGTRTRRTNDRFIRLKARTDDGQFTQTLSTDINFVATDQCTGSEDFAY